MYGIAYRYSVKEIGKITIENLKDQAGRRHCRFWWLDLIGHFSGVERQSHFSNLHIFQNFLLARLQVLSFMTALTSSTISCGSWILFTGTPF